MEAKKRTKQEKLAILKQASEQGVVKTLEEHGLYPATFYYWKRKFEAMGESGLAHGMTPAHLKRIRQLEKENKALKELVAEKELESKLKGELLKKKEALRRRKI